MYWHLAGQCILWILTLPFLAEAGISDARFQRLFRVDLTGVQSGSIRPAGGYNAVHRRVSEIPWKEWIKKHARESNGFPTLGSSEAETTEKISCSNERSTIGACCDANNGTCDAAPSLQCVDHRCVCRVGSALNKSSGECESAYSKQLTEACTEGVDNCYTAYSMCISGVCQCMEGFKPDGLECVPTMYRCPYDDPFMEGARPRLCDVNEITTSASGNDASGSGQCPSGFECVHPADPYRPRFITTDGTEKGYCCPLIPDVNRTIVFQEQCFLGEFVPPLECPQDTHVYATAISAAPLCCPKPCRPNYSAVIVNGQCVATL